MTMTIIDELSLRSVLLALTCERMDGWGVRMVGWLGDGLEGNIRKTLLTVLAAGRNFYKLFSTLNFYDFFADMKFSR